MQIKTQCSIFTYKYLIMFDLASKNTGVCIWDVQNKEPLSVSMLRVSGKTELPAGELYTLLDNFFNVLFKEVNREDILVCKEAMPTQLRGGSSTVQTFIALARSHAILDLYTFENNIAIYDYTGVYPASTHAYFKKVMEWDNTHKVEKIDIQNYINEKYHIKCDTLDESDAVFLAETLIGSKWNKDIDEAIKIIKKHKKELKSQKAIESCDEEIIRLGNLKIS